MAATLEREVPQLFASSASIRGQVIPSRWVIVAVIAFTIFVTSACSVMQPHVNVPVDTSPPLVVFASGLNFQLVRGKLLQQSYMDAVADKTLLTNSLASAAIPVSAAALAVGIINPGTTFTRDFLTGAGVGVAAALGLGSFLVDPRRDPIYYQGAKEIYCLALAISPLAVGDNEFDKMRDDVSGLRSNLANAAAVGVDAALIDQGNNIFAAGGNLVRDIARAGLIFSNELDKINIAVNAQIASQERNIADIGTAISTIQKTPLNAPAGAPTARTQGARALSATGAEARLRRSIEAVTAWLVLYNTTVTTAAANLQAAQCLPATAASPLQAQPIVIVTNGQRVTVIPAGQDNAGGPASVIAVPTAPPTPPPPRITHKAPPPSASAEPPAVITVEDQPVLHTNFALAPTETAFPNSKNFQSKVATFQRCKGDTATGRLNDTEKTVALAGKDVCLPINQPTGPAPGGGPTGQPPSPPGKR
jgi:hypothetical protein